jgi:hypothetical protein
VAERREVTETAAEGEPDPEGITRRLVPWLVPYSALCLLAGWRILDWPASGMPFGPALSFYPQGWLIILALECLPLLGLLPWIWRIGVLHAAIVIGVTLTLSTDLMLFTFTMIRTWDLAGAGTALLLIIKVGFDGWVLGRVSERRESFDERVRQSVTAQSAGSD